MRLTALTAPPSKPFHRRPGTFIPVATWRWNVSLLPFVLYDTAGGASGSLAYANALLVNVQLVDRPEVHRRHAGLRDPDVLSLRRWERERRKRRRAHPTGQLGPVGIVRRHLQRVAPRVVVAVGEVLQ